MQGVLRSESVEALYEPAFDLALEAADLYSPDDGRERMMSELADLAVGLAEQPVQRQVALRALAQMATTNAHFAALAAAAKDDVDLGWRTLVRLAEVRDVSASEIEVLAARDPDPDSWVKALAVNAARPGTAGKDAAWKAIVEEHRVPMGSVGIVGRAIWRRSQDRMLAPYTERYLELLPALDDFGMIPALSIGSSLFPRSVQDETFIERATEAANKPNVSPVVRRVVIESCDRLRRRLRARRL